MTRVEASFNGVTPAVVVKTGGASRLVCKGSLTAARRCEGAPERELACHGAPARALCLRQLAFFDVTERREQCTQRLDAVHFQGGVRGVLLVPFEEQG